MKGTGNERGTPSCPDIPPGLIDYLKFVYRNVLPEDLTLSDRELGALIGEQRVIQHLDQKAQAQEKRRRARK